MKRTHLRPTDAGFFRVFSGAVGSLLKECDIDLEGKPITFCGRDHIRSLKTQIQRLQRNLMEILH